MRFTNIELAGTTYQLRFTHNAIADIEDKAERGIGELFLKGMAFSASRLLLWGGLRWKMPALTIEKAGQMIQNHLEKGGSLDEIALRLFEGLKDSGVIKDSPAESAEGVDPLAETTAASGAVATQS